MLKANDWYGKHVAILGSGASVRKTYRMSHGVAKVIGVNRAPDLLSALPNVWMMQDWDPWRHGREDPLYLDIPHWAVKKAIWDGEPVEGVEDKLSLWRPRPYDSDVGTDPSSLWNPSSGTTTVIPAINLALILGATRIEIHGVDLCGAKADGTAHHFYDGPPANADKPALNHEAMGEALNQLYADHKDKAKLVNYSPKSKGWVWTP